MSEALRAKPRVTRAENRGGIPDPRPGVVEHSRQSVWLLWHLKSVWCLDSTQQKGAGCQLWGTRSVSTGSGSQIRGAGSEIRRDPPPNLIPALVVLRPCWLFVRLRVGGSSLGELWPRQSSSVRQRAGRLRPLRSHVRRPDDPPRRTCRRLAVRRRRLETTLSSHEVSEHSHYIGHQTRVFSFISGHLPLWRKQHSALRLGLGLRIMIYGSG